ncbi:MAG: energy-coupling factor ABC transporter ATP-binding protein [Propionibacteriaceae bacterium]|jgi:energy-coupling factor transport system ATP-binding protein|nr:energy-coupling factor ABC transporter ATP-binding protein [Propionibacteriaceae bacterium]
MVAIRAASWGWRYATRSAWAIRHLDWQVEAGERVLVLGASGSGKSTLLAGLAGILQGDEGQAEGSLTIDGQPAASRRAPVGLVQQDPSSQIVLERVGDELAFGLENLALPAEHIWPLVDQNLERVHLNVARSRSTSALSGGQQQRLALASVLAMTGASADSPGIILLDEPTANLDPVGIDQIHQTISNLTDPHLTWIMVEHHAEIWLDWASRVVVFDAGRIVADGPPNAILRQPATQATLAAAGVWAPGLALPEDLQPLAGVDQTNQAGPKADPSDRAVVITGAKLSIGYQAEAPIRQGLNLTITEGRSTMLIGPNGAGKTTLGLTLAGLLPKLAGDLQVANSLRPAASTRRQRRWVSDDAMALADPIRWTSPQQLTRLGTVLQNPEAQFVTSRVRDELAVGLIALGLPKQRRLARVDQLLADLHLENLADANPFTLSGGQKRRLSVGTILASNPAVLILDEPTFGQDRNSWIDLVRLISRIVDDGGTVVTITHDQRLIELLGQDIIDLGVATP